MTKDDIKTIAELQRLAQELPNQLQPPGAPSDSLGRAEWSHTAAAATAILDRARVIRLRAAASLRAIDGPECGHAKTLEHIPFETDIVQSTAASASMNDRYGRDRAKLIEVLQGVHIEFETRAVIEKKDKSWRGFLGSKEARLTILVGVVGLLTGFITKELLPGILGPRELKWSDLGGAFANFEVVDHERVVDLRAWTPTVPGDTVTLDGKALFINNLIVRKVRDEGLRFCLTGASSGSNPLVTSSTHDVTQQNIDMRLTGWPNLKNQVIGIATIPAEVQGGMEFPLNMNSLRYRGFSDPEKEWCSIGIWHPTRRLVNKVLFPKGKMGSHFVCSTAFFYDRNNFKDVLPDSTAVSRTDTSFTWVINNPVIGNAYRIDWEW